jgi:hypothetical protein
MLWSTWRPSSDHRFGSPIQRQLCQPPAFRVLAKATLSRRGSFRGERAREFHIFPSLFPLPETALCDWLGLSERRACSQWSRTDADGAGAAMRSNDRCGARTRSGEPCQREALKNGRCAHHGGLSTGPRTREGLARIAAAARKRWLDWRRQRGTRAGPTH